MTNEIKIVLAILVAGSIIGAGVYFSKDSKEETVTIPQTTTLSSTFKDNFIEGCLEKDTSKYTLCSCMYDKLEENLGVQGVMDMSLEYLKTNQLPTNVFSIIAPCVK